MKNPVFLFLSILLLFSSCNKESGCENIICQHGECINDSCDCNQGYTGRECNKQVTPSKITVTQLIINSFPQSYKGRTPWDSTSNGADIYISIAGYRRLLYTSDFYFKNATIGPFIFDLEPDIDIFNFDEEYSITVLDFDPKEDNEDGDFNPESTDDYVGSLHFDIYDSKNGFPEKMQLSRNGLRIDVFLEYTWD